jgi:uncharacterized protein (TIGR03086 family)
MTGGRANAPLLGGVALLERAINYTRGSLRLVTPTDMSRPSPCEQWSLRALLDHMNDSLKALNEAVDVGHVDVDAAWDDGAPAIDPVATLQNRACRLLGAWTNADQGETVSVGGCPLSTGILTSTGALEVAVHGWDVAQACGWNRAIPDELAEELLALAPLLVTDDDRPARFAGPLDVSPLAGPGERLVAFLGRRPAH